MSDWTGTGTTISAAAAYATVAQLREYLPQVPAGATYDALLLSVLERATALIDRRLGFGFATPALVATDKDFRNARTTDTLYLPAYSAGSITHVYELAAKGSTSESTDEVLSTDYDVLDDGSLYRYSGWPAGWYRVTAIWGYGAAPADIVQICLETAINLWGTRDSRQISDVIGVEGGGAVGYQRSWTNKQHEVLTRVRAEYGQFGIA